MGLRSASCETFTCTAQRGVRERSLSARLPCVPHEHDQKGQQSSLVRRVCLSHVRIDVLRASKSNKVP
jgi:hypothetical protein